MRSDISTQVDGPSTTSIESGPNLLEALATGAVLGFGAGYVVAKRCVHSPTFRKRKCLNLAIDNVG